MKEYIFTSGTRYPFLGEYEVAIMILFSEDFSSGFFDTGEIGGKAEWFYFIHGDFTARDPQSRVGFRKNRLSVNIPRFSLTAAGIDDHFKFLFFKNHVNKETGFPGFPVPESGSLGYEIVAKFRALGTDDNPFEVSPDDYRLSNGAILSLDFENFTIFGFLITATKVHLLYERWPLDDTVENTASFFSYVIPSSDIEPGTEHVYKVVYSAHENRISWYIDKKQVFSFDQFGKRLEDEFDEYLVQKDQPEAKDPGDIPVIFSRQRVFGAGICTYLDAGMRQDSALVDVYDINIEKDWKVFGQGGELILGNFSVFTG